MSEHTLSVQINYGALTYNVAMAAVPRVGDHVLLRAPTGGWIDRPVKYVTWMTNQPEWDNDVVVVVES